MKLFQNDFKSFYLNTFNSIVRFAASYIDNDGEIQDIAQEAFIRVYENWDSLKTEEQARSYTYITTRNLCISRIRHLNIKEQFIRYELEKVDAEKDEAFMSELTYQETLRILHRAIDALPKQTRQIILLGLEGKTNHEIAEALEISINTVKTLKKGAYKSLRNSLGGSISIEEIISFLLVMRVPICC